MPYWISKSQSWQEGAAKNVTLILTENCQLSCGYCYLTGKNNRRKMSLSVAKKAIDFILEREDLFPQKSLILELIGGEPFLEIELIDKVCNYFKVSSYEKSHPWFDSYRFSISTNGLLYGSPKVQKFIEDNIAHLSIGISIDGTPLKHNLQRKYPNGIGSYDDVVKNVPGWLIQFPFSHTKATIASDDLPYIKESVLHLWSLGIQQVNMNVVFENVWKEGDDLIFEDQLIQLADTIIKDKLYIDYYCSLFDRNIGLKSNHNNNWCGAGKMLAIGINGDFYPCIRFMPYALEKQKARIIGSVKSGININLLRPFLSLDNYSQSSNECLTCEISSGCAWCQGLNYDVSESSTIFHRATFICKMHKARVKANKYFFDILDNISAS